MSSIDPLYLEALEQFRVLFEELRSSGVKEPTAMTLATSDRAGRPSARVVLLKHFDPAGFVFYTNITSRKGAQLLSNPAAALCFYWPTLERQVHIEGSTSLVQDQEADAYWASRPRESQIGGWASLQSKPLDRREDLEERIKRVEAQYENQAVPRPPHWTGFRLAPERIEFWRMRPYRLHERVLYSGHRGKWSRGLLFP